MVAFSPVPLATHDLKHKFDKLGVSREGLSISRSPPNGVYLTECSVLCLMVFDGE